MKQIIPLIVLSFFITLVPPVFAGRRPPSPTSTPTPTPTPTTKSVCIDPGHGGSEIGTSNQEYLEKDVNLQVALLLKQKLLDSKYTVHMTREDDRDLSNADRYNFCNSMNTSILLSIHHNGSTDPTIDYTTSLYMKSSDVALAREVTNTVSSSLDLPNQGISKFASGVLLKSDMPAAISEVFLNQQC